MERTTDEEVADQAATGDDSAFSTLVDRYSLRLVRFLCLCCSIPIDSADDVAQESWLKAWRALPRKLPGPFRGWLFEIARNNAKDWLRSAAHRHQQSQRGLELLAGHAGRENDPDQTAEHRDTLSKLAECLKKLPVEFREPVLAHAAGEQYEAIAQRCRIPIGTGKSQIARGRGGLRKCLEGAGE